MSHSESTTLRDGWYVYHARNVDPDKTGLYEWHIEGVGSYIGKYTDINRTKCDYVRNIHRLLNGDPYRLRNPHGFRRIHLELQRACRNGTRVTLTLLENVNSNDMNRRKRELIAERGALNDPPFGRRQRSGKLVTPEAAV